MGILHKIAHKLLSFDWFINFFFLGLDAVNYVDTEIDR